MSRYADLSLCILTFSLLYVFATRKKRSNLPLPPGPKGLPLIGNLLDMPSEFEWKKYHEWCKEYDTDILYLNIAGTDIVVLDTSEAATDLLETRSSLYSGRPRMPMINELMGWDFNFGFSDYGPSWRRHRRFMHLSFHPAAAKQFQPHITRSTRNLLLRFLDDPHPHQIIPHLRRMAGETILDIAYGIEIQAENDPYIEGAKKANHPLIVAAIPGTFLVDSIPLLKYVPAWVPGASFRRKAAEWRKFTRNMVELPYAESRKNLAAGKTTVSIVSSGLEKLESGVEDPLIAEDVIQNVAGALYSAGSDTTVSAISSCILGLLEHPEVLKKAQAQIDAVIKPGHLPDFEDEPSLPYITAIAKETLRWRDVVPIAIPHKLSVDDEYKGYRLPAGAIVISNAWALLHDERVYPDPFTFNPDRFINPDTGKIDHTHARDPAHACWGFGRRICPGRFMAFSAVWLSIASLIAVFDFEKAKVKVKTTNGLGGGEEEEERTVPLTHEYLSALVVTPKTFECVIRPRSKEKEELIRQAVTLQL